MTNQSTAAPGSIDFVWQPHRNYAYIQGQIFGLIDACLPPRSVIHTIGETVKGTLSVSLFIRQSREKVVATPADIILAMFLAYKFTTSLHPRNRDTKTPTLDKLVGSDVIISDFGTMVFEAWELEKPVIFPRWCIDVEALVSRNPLSAEAHIYPNKIGLHPEMQMNCCKF